jgi:Protein of unknown function (DUF5661)
MRNVLIMGAGGRDFRDFNVVFRDDQGTRVVAFTAARIPGIEDRVYPASLAGLLYPDGIPVRPEEELPELVRRHAVDEVVFAYSDVTHRRSRWRPAPTSRCSGLARRCFAPPSPSWPRTTRYDASGQRRSEAQRNEKEDITMARTTFTTEEARSIGAELGIDWDASPFDVEQFRAGMDIELEHGTRDTGTNVTDDDALSTGKIALAHLRELPDYYTRLARMEAEAEAVAKP